MTRARLPFDRMKRFGGSTLAWRLFKRHHTHFNDIYWANRAASVFAFGATRPFHRTDPATTLFSLPGNSQRLPATLGSWADQFSDFQKWAQLASVVAICGYLETYMAQVATAALESSPALLFGGGTGIDGVGLLKSLKSLRLSD